MFSEKGSETINNVILGIAIISFIFSEITIFYLSGEMAVIIAHLLYFPIILAALKYPRQAVIMSVLIGLLYIVVVGIFIQPGSLNIIPAMTQFYVYVSLTVVISSFSMKMQVHEKRYRNVFNNSGNGICVLNGDTYEVVEQNNRCCNILNDASGCGPSGSIPLWNNDADMKAFFKNLHDEGIVQGYEISRMSENDTEQHLLVSASSLPDGNISVNIADITERKNTERRITEREKIFHFLADNIVDASLIFEKDGSILFGNRAAIIMTGIDSVDELKRKNINEFLISDGLSQLSSEISETAGNDTGTFQTTCKFQGVGGEIKWVEGRGAHITFLEKPAYIITFRDVTQQKQAEYNTIIQRDLGLELASISSVERASELSLDAAMKVGRMNCGRLYLFDTESGDFVLTSSRYVSDGENDAPSPVMDDLSIMQLILSGKPFYFDYGTHKFGCNDSQNGELLSAFGMIPIMDMGEVIGCFNVASHESETISAESRAELETIATQVGNAISRIQAEESSNENRINLQMLFDSLNDFLIVCDTQGNILYTNPVVATQLGYQEDELKKMTIFDIYPHWAQEEAKSVIDDAKKGLHEFSRPPFMTKDGQEIPVETKITSGIWDSQPALLAISRDISARIRALDALRRRDEILDAVSFSAGRFLGDSMWENHLADVLQRLGEATDSCRTCVFQNYSDQDSGSLCSGCVSEWKADGVSLLAEDFVRTGISYKDVFSLWQESLSAGNPLNQNISALSKSERDYFESLGICSLMVLPIYVDSKWWGFIGFIDCEHEREWPQAEIDALQVAAGIIGSAIHRTQTDEVFRNPVENSLVCTYIIQDGNVRYINPRGAEIFGYERSELIEYGYSRLIHPDDLPVVEEFSRRRFSGETDSSFYTFRGVRKSGEEIFCEAYGALITYMGSPAIVGTLMDITERKKAEQRIDHLHRVILAVRNVNELIIREKDRERLVQNVCRTLTETRGYYSASIFLIEGDYVKFHSSEAGTDDALIFQIKCLHRSDLSEQFENVLASSEVKIITDPDMSCANSFLIPHPADSAQMCVRLEHGGEIYGMLTISLPLALSTDPEEIALFVEVTDDIAFALHGISLEEERREAENELMIKNNAISSSISGILIYDLNGNVTYVNDASVALWGYDAAEEMLGKSMTELLVQKEQGNDLLTNLYDEGRYIGEVTAKKKDGSSFTGQAHASNIVDNNGRPVCLMASVVDVTETKRAEEALRYSENLYRTIFGNSGTALALLEEDGLISLANATLEKLFGYSLDEVEGKLKWDIFVAEKDRESIHEYFSADDEEGDKKSWQYEAELYTKSGDPKYGFISIDMIPGTKRHVMSFVDITELKDYQQQIKESLDEKSVLLMEVHHRVKNNLQIISGLIKLQALSIGNDAAVAHLRECENRIMTMSLVHESLYQSDNLAQINAREHLERLASNILRSETDTANIALNVAIDDISLNLDTAIPCSLIVNELLTNSIKYAFENDKEGNIWIEFHKGPDGLLTLVVADDGQGVPADFDINTATSLGLKLVTRLLRSQLKGTLDVSGENGARFTLKFYEKNKS